MDERTTGGIRTRINRATRSHLPAQRTACAGVGDDRIYVDHGLTGANRDRPGLRVALAACRAGDTLVVTKLDRLADDGQMVSVGSKPGASDRGVPEPHHISFIDLPWNRTRTKEHQSEEVFFDVKLFNTLRQASPRFVVWTGSC
jgi:hypothetical protein